MELLISRAGYNVQSTLYSMCSSYAVTRGQEM